MTAVHAAQAVRTALVVPAPGGAPEPALIPAPGPGPGTALIPARGPDPYTPGL